MNIQLITCDSGDWYVLKVDGKVYEEGHDVPEHVWMRLLQEKFNAICEEITIGDFDMEMGNY